MLLIPPLPPPLANSHHVCFQKAIQTASNLTSTLLKHHVAPRLEMILDKEAKISHELLSAQIEARLGSGEGSSAKGPDMKVWNKGKGLNDVRYCYERVRALGTHMTNQ